LEELDSALLIYDEQGGYRGFLGADTDSAWDLGQSCHTLATLHHSFVMPAAVEQAAHDLARAIQIPAAAAPGRKKPSSLEPSAGVIRFIRGKFFPEMLDAVCARIQALVFSTGVSPSQIAVLGPYLSDALRFALAIRLQAMQVPVRTHRPSRSLRDEPAAGALLTLAALAHPHWNSPPPPFDIAGLFLTVLDMDLVRAHLLADIVFRKGFTLLPFDDLNADARERITEDMGLRYSRLREWIMAYREGQPQPLDYFFRRIFGEVLSQPGFGFHERLDEVRVVGSLVESVTKFRLAMEPSVVDMDHADFDVGREYIRVLDEGVLAAQYLGSWKQDAGDAVLIAPAYSFLMMNRPVAFQFWLDPGSSGWFERLDQPLTHTRVLSRTWPRDKKWNLAEEELENMDGMTRLAVGLLRRCSRQAYLCVSQLGESGFEQRGSLLLALQQAFHESETVDSN
jgi:hypothetical protein